MTLRTVPPRLLAILAALTDEPEPWWQEQVRSGWLTYEGIYSWVSAFPWQGVAGWRTTEAAEAFELLVTAGLLPDTWVGDPTRAWCCARCDGKAEITNLAAAPEPCRVCENGALPLGSPLSIPALIGWALPDSSVRLQQEELARAALPFLQSKGLPRGPARILWRSFRREIYGKTIPVAWVAPGGPPRDAVRLPRCTGSLVVAERLRHPALSVPPSSLGTGYEPRRGAPACGSRGGLSRRSATGLCRTRATSSATPQSHGRVNQGHTLSRCDGRGLTISPLRVDSNLS